MQQKLDCKLANMILNNSIRTLVRRLTLGATIYLICQERIKTFQQTKLTVEAMTFKLMSLKVKDGIPEC